MTGLTLLFADSITRPAPLDLSAYKYTPFAIEAAEENNGVWSPDGKSIAYLKRNGNGTTN